MSYKAKKYKIITKVGNNSDGTAHCIKYNVNDLRKFCDFLDSKYPDWRWFNVYDYSTGEQLDSFTKFNRPVGKFI